MKCQQNYKSLQYCSSAEYWLSPYVFSLMSSPYTLQGCGLSQTLVEQGTENRKYGAWATQAAVSNRFFCTDYPFLFMHMVVLSTYKQISFPLQDSVRLPFSL